MASCPASARYFPGEAGQAAADDRDLLLLARALQLLELL